MTTRWVVIGVVALFGICLYLAIDAASDPSPQQSYRAPSAPAPTPQAQAQNDNNAMLWWMFWNHQGQQTVVHEHYHVTPAPSPVLHVSPPPSAPKPIVIAKPATTYKPVTVFKPMSTPSYHPSASGGYHPSVHISSGHH